MITLSGYHYCFKVCKKGKSDIVENGIWTKCRNVFLTKKYAKINNFVQNAKISFQRSNTLYLLSPTEK
jgi:hypothetical protein